MKTKFTESDIQRGIMQTLRFNGWFCFKNHQTLGSYKGVADVTAIKNGRTVWIGVKTPTGTQSPYQIQFENDVRPHGGEYCVMRSIEDAIRFCGNKVVNDFLSSGQKPQTQKSKNII